MLLVELNGESVRSSVRARYKARRVTRFLVHLVNLFSFLQYIFARNTRRGLPARSSSLSAAGDVLGDFNARVEPPSDFRVRADSIASNSGSSILGL